MSRILQIGIGLLCLQQLSGTNGVLFYSSTIFETAGEKKMVFHVTIMPFFGDVVLYAHIYCVLFCMEQLSEGNKYLFQFMLDDSYKLP